ncbi:VOC family protein [Kibdelosporangium philippinense]|uniref:VOC family protein n=1 Tax=Kibdelosporangium philippinense TaxID=211113 RepID=A0ABS8Z856_9PSEU|nr:VOC family protein [Kibdelosporangium philippinense]MCE7004071.1 VOC family protein [Kibdelosporangium philippinense]
MGFVQVRFARPTDRLAEVVAFYAEGLGLPGAGCHLEFTSHVDGSPGPAPTEENLLVLYFGDAAGMAEVVERLGAAGHAPVGLENPYWSANGALGFADPDGWRVVLVPQPVFAATG